MIIVLDSGPLGLVTNPRVTAETQAAAQRLASLARRIPVLVPEITDYELRHELLQAKKVQGIRRLDQFKATGAYIPLTTAAMLQAALFWAQARQQGQPTASSTALDGDVILAGQAVILAQQTAETVIVATTNVIHLARFVDARQWHTIM